MKSSVTRLRSSTSKSTPLAGRPQREQAVDAVPGEEGDVRLEGVLVQHRNRRRRAASAPRRSFRGSIGRLYRAALRGRTRTSDCVEQSSWFDLLGMLLGERTPCRSATARCSGSRSRGRIAATHSTRSSSTSSHKHSSTSVVRGRSCSQAMGRASAPAQTSTGCVGRSACRTTRNVADANAMRQMFETIEPVSPRLSLRASRGMHSEGAQALSQRQTSRLPSRARSSRSRR